MKFKAFLLLLCLIPTLATAELKFIPVFHQTPESVVLKVKPFLQDGEMAVAGQNEVILRANSKNVEDILKLIHKLDQAAHRLLILVNRNGRFNEQNSGYNVNINGKVGVGSGTRSSLNTKTKIYSTHTLDVDKSTEKIHVLDGYSAYISTGVSEATPVVQINQYGRHQQITTGTQYRDSSKGFYVTPRLSKDSVVLKISPWKEEPLASNRTSAKFHRVSTVIRGRLNSWIALSGVKQSDKETSSELLGRHHQTTSSSNTVWVKVIDLDR